MEISTSILSVKKEDAIQTFYNIETAKTDYFHIDVMDGKFVPKNTLEFMKESAQTITHISNIPLDVHLMVEEPLEIIEEYISLNPGCIIVHMESKEYKEAIKRIKEAGIKAGISLKPNTPVEDILDMLPQVNTVLVMTVEPGLGGQEIILDTLEKISYLKEYRDKNNLDFNIEVDGGINLKTIELVSKEGADIAVCGTAIISSDNMAETIKELKSK